MKLKRRKIKRGRIEIIPMIDTIVILLIFYMSFARFAEQTRENNIKLPQSRAGDEFSQRPNQVVVNMYDIHDVTVDKTHYTVADLPALLRHLRQSDPRYANLSVILRASKDMTYADLSGFMKACAKAGIVDVTFTTLEIR